MTPIVHIQVIPTGGKPPETCCVHHFQLLQRSVFGIQCSVFSSRTNQSDPEPNWYIYHSDHLGSSAFLTDASGDPTQHLQYMPFGETFVEQRSVTSYYTPYTFSAKERDTETGYSYFGARYYDADISVWLSVDPMSDERSWLSPYNYCLQNPIGRVDIDGQLCGDYYDVQGNWLGSDGKNDDRAYVAEAKNSDGTFKNAKLLSIKNSELLDRATWVYGECAGSNELITSRTQNAGQANAVKNATVSEYYAFAINNIAKLYGDFYQGAKSRLKKIVSGKTQSTYEGYFKGEGIGGNVNSKAFASKRASGMEELMKLDGANHAIGAVIKSVTHTSDPTGGSRAWLGKPDAVKYVNDSKKIFSMGGRKASLQFSFTSSNKNHYHTFYKI
jgi:RHS repeat-associated protein